MKKSQLIQIIKEEIKLTLKETRGLLPNANPKTLARSTEESDKEYIITNQKRNKISQDIYKKSYKELTGIQKDNVNNKL